MESREDHLWTSAEAAHAFRVGVSSIKRWTDEGELEAVKTPGGHRRYTVPALYRFATLRNLATDRLPPVDPLFLEEELPPPADVSLYEALAAGDATAVRRLVTPNVGRLAQRAAFFDRVVGDALREIGYRWERGELGVDEEHRASHIIAEALDRLRPAHASRNANGPLAVLACPPGEHHELPLRLVRLMFEWSGWRTELAGAHLPWPSARHAVERACPAILAFTSRHAAFYDEAEFDELLRHCERRGTRVITGGDWARGGTGGASRYLRFRTMKGFEKWLRQQ
ncbi:MAG TPA: B12-binding domain-containing protein [Thermoanaerobaculia bacterium]|nr:B12-binding domain-containing protein [Thermoanaerobaculia bacterium]